MEVAARAEGTEPCHRHKSQGPLSSAWEIAVVVSLLALLALVIGTVIWQTRRKRRRQRARMLDVEGREAPPPPDFAQDIPISKPPPVFTTK